GQSYADSSQNGGDQAMVARDTFRDVDVPDNAGYLSYGVHPRIMPDISSPNAKTKAFTGKIVYDMQPYKISKVRRASEVMLAADASLALIIDGGLNLQQSNATIYNLDHKALQGNPGNSGPSSFLID